MKKFRFLCFIFAVLLCVVAPVGVCAEGTASASQTNGCVSLMAQKPLNGSDKLLDTAKGVILYELESKTLVYAYQPDKQVDPSGMNKIMTALLALENADPQEEVTLMRNPWDYAPAGSVSAELKKGETMKLIDLIYCMMVGSANDAASVIAEHVGGNLETFVAMMNQKAMELGCKSTNFANAHGIKAEGQYSTARDLAIITEAALQNETFVEIFSTVKYTVPATNKAKVRELNTSNNMMRPANKDYFDERVTGGRTGALSTTDRSLICTAEANGSRYLSVVMSASGSVTDDPNIVDKFGSYEETKALLDYGFGKFSVFNLMLKDHAMAQFAVVDGENKVSVCPDQTVRVALPTGAVLSDITYRCVENGSIQAPIAKDQVLGYIEAWYNGICVAKYDLLAMHDVKTVADGISPLVPTYQAPPKNDTVKDLWVWLVIAGLFALAGLLMWVLIKRIQKSIERKRVRKALRGAAK